MTTETTKTLYAPQRSLVFIAAPLNAPTRAKQARHIERAILLGRYAWSAGLTPVIPHVNGYALFGIDRPEVREEALEWCKHLAAVTAQLGGVLWVLTTDEGLQTDGMKEEIEVYESCQGLSVREWEWSSLRHKMQKIGLLEEWEALVIGD